MFRTIAACAIMLTAPAAHAGWRGAEWSMTPGQVAAAMQGEAPLTRAGKNGKADENTAGNNGEYVWDGDRFDTRYYYDANGLRSVALELVGKGPKARATKCAALYEKIRAAHGAPLRESDQTILRLVIWHDKASQNRLRLMITPGAGICTLYYERLGDYEAHDIANPGKEAKPPKVTGMVGGSPVETITH